MSRMSPEKQAVRKAAAKHLHPHRVEFWESVGIPLVIGKREGEFMWDLDGHRLYDLHLNGGTFNLGHRNPEVIAELVQATSEVDVGNHHFPSMAAARLSETMAQLTPPNLEYFVFSPSGGEAIDIAIKSARRATGRRKIVSFEHGYHGRTGLSGAAGDASDARYFHSDLPDDFSTIAFADLEDLRRQLEREDVAAVLLETIPATWGFPKMPPNYLSEAVDLAHRFGALFISDEVQTGLGRTEKLWAFEHFGIEPDIMVVGKGFSGGIYPIAATGLNKAAGGWLHEHGWAHVATFGGTELGARVAARVMSIVTRPDVVANVSALAQTFADELATLQSRDDYLAEVRQLGLVMGLRFDHPHGAVYMQRALYNEGVWAIASGFDQSVLQLKPTLLMNPAKVGDVCERIAAAIDVAREQTYEPPRRRPRASLAGGDKG